MSQQQFAFNEETNPFKGKGSVNKKDLCLEYRISYATLGKLLNTVFFEELKEVGYTKYQSILSPKVIQKFVELYGVPL